MLFNLFLKFSLICLKKVYYFTDIKVVKYDSKIVKYVFNKNNCPTSKRAQDMIGYILKVSSVNMAHVSLKANRGPFKNMSALLPPCIQSITVPLF